MLRNKDIKDLSELKSLFVHKHKKEEYFTKMIDILKSASRSATMLIESRLIEFYFTKKSEVAPRLTTLEVNYEYRLTILD